MSDDVKKTVVSVCVVQSAATNCTGKIKVWVNRLQWGEGERVEEVGGIHGEEGEHLSYFQQ